MTTLRTTLAAISLLAVLCSGASAAGDWEWIPFEEGAPEGTEPEAVAVQSDQQSTTIDFAVRGMYREQKVEEGETYDVLRFTRPLGSRSIVKGCPEVPLVLWNIAIPPTTNVRVGLDSAFVPAVTLEGYRVYPSQPLYNEGDPRPPFTYDEEVYARDSFYPGEMVELGDISVVCGVREVLVRLKPVQFNPVTGELMVYTSGRVVLEYYGLSDVNTVENPRPPSPHFEDFLSSIILNYGFLSALGYGPSAVLRQSWGAVKGLF